MGGNLGTIQEDIYIYQNSTHTMAEYNGAVISTSLISLLRDDVVFAAALDACPEYGIVKIRGDFTFASTVTGTKSVTIISIGGSITIPSSMNHYEGLYATQDHRAFVFTGTTSLPIVLTSNADKYATSLTIESTNGLTGGQLLYIGDTSSYDGFSSFLNGEICEIGSITSTTVCAINSPTQCAYTTANSAYVIPATPISVHLVDIKFVGTIYNSFAVDFVYCKNSSVKGCTFDTITFCCVRVDNCYNVDISGNGFSHCSFNYGYGIVIYKGSKFVDIHHNHFSPMLNAITSGLISYSGGSLPGIPSEIRIYENTIIVAPIYTQLAYTQYIYNNVIKGSAITGGGLDLLIEGNTFYKCNTVFVPNLYISGKKLTIRNNRVFFDEVSDCIISATSGGATRNYTSMDIEGNECWGGNIAKLSSTPISTLVIRNNTINSVTATNIAGANHGISVNGGATNIYPDTCVDGNFITGVGGNGISLTNVIGTCRNNHIYNPGRIGAGTNYGILLTQTTTGLCNVLCGGNRIESASSDFMTYGIGEAVADASKVTNTIPNNYILNAVTSKYLVAGTYTGGMEKSGVTASVAWNGTIAHGLGTTPKWAIVTPSTASEFASVTTLDATNITVSVKKHDNTNGTTQTLYWSCGL